jgi:DNA-binding response OmpR family regulator
MQMLIVEDDPDGREILAELFRRRDWSVVAVATTEAALRELRRGPVDILISDEDLAGTSGSAMLRVAAVEGLLRNVGVLMYTAQRESLEVPPGVRMLQKPLTTASLVEEVTSTLALVSTAPTSSAAAGPPSARDRSGGGARDRAVAPAGAR